MATPIHSAAAAAPLRAPPSALIDAMNALRRVAQSIDAWLDARERAAADRDLLARMSDRELKDIGIDRGSASAVAEGAWKRDYPW